LFGLGFLRGRACARPRRKASEGRTGTKKPPASGAAAGLLLAAVLIAPPAEAKEMAPRVAFEAALAALESGRMTDYRALKTRLTDYPLYPYLEFHELVADLDKVLPPQVHRFIARYGDQVPLAERLERQWLRHLAEAGRWSLYRREYHEGLGTEFDCHYASAQLNTGHEDRAWSRIESLWLVGESQPPACDYPFQAWREAGKMDSSHVLRRIGKAMYRDEVGLTGYLKRFLPARQRHWIDRWLGVHRDPAGEIRRLVKEKKGFWTALLYRYGIVELAGRDAKSALHLWRRDRARYGYSASRRNAIERILTLNLAFQHEPEALGRLEAMAEKRGAPWVRRWQVRLALWHNRWQDALNALNRLPAAEQDSPEWSYWRARAREKLGDHDGAKAAYRTAAQCRCYYGHLASERLGTPHAVGTRPLKVATDKLEKLRARPELVRIKELLALQWKDEARAEWERFVQTLPAHQMDAAAYLAEKFGWPDNAIIALGRSSFLSDLELRFPTPYSEPVEDAVSKHKLDKALLYGLMRQESAFQARARSAAGALGVMQLMPATARKVARRLGEPEPAIWRLLGPAENIRIGAAHLDELLRRYGGNPVYALAAYNAGHHRVLLWQPENRSVPADIWIANIPFSETRDYVEQILVNARIYGWRLGRDRELRSAYLGEMLPLAHLASSDRTVSSSNERTARLPEALLP